MEIVALGTLKQSGYRDKALSIAGQLPPFSPVLNRLLASLAKEDVSFAYLAEWIEKDTVLSGHVLRLVNSAAYGMVGTISSVRHAISILGLVKLRNTALGLSVCRMWTGVRAPKGWSTARFNLHAAATAVMSDLLAQVLPVEYPEGAFVSGLMHDVGRLLIALGLPQEYIAIQEKQQAERSAMYDCETTILGFNHAELSALVLHKWNLPEPICRAVEFHHKPPAAEGDLLALSRIVQAADQAVNLMDITVVASPPRLQGSAEDVLGELGLKERSNRILEEFASEYETLKSFF